MKNSRPRNWGEGVENPAPDLIDTLPAWEPEALHSIFPESQVLGKDVKVTLDEDHTHRRQASGRRFLEITSIARAADQLRPLPKLGESLHGIMRCNYAAFDVIEAVLELAGQPAEELNIATLGFNSRNSDRLLQLIDAGKIKRCTFICSHFYKSGEGEVYDRLHYELTRRGQTCLAMRCHAKLLMFTFADGQAYAFESSANLRSCKNLEQFVLTRDPELVAWHRAWMYEVFKKAEPDERPKTKTAKTQRAGRQSRPSTAGAGNPRATRSARVP